MATNLSYPSKSRLIAKDILRDFQLFIMNYALIVTSIGFGIDVMQNLDAFNWLIENKNENAFVLLAHSTNVVVINSFLILGFLYLFYLLKRRKVGIVKVAALYSITLSIAILVPYFWQAFDQEMVAGHLSRDIILYTISLFVVSTCTFGKYVFHAGIFAAALCVSVSIISKNPFLLVNLPLYCFMMLGFSFALWKKDTLLKKIVNKQSEEKLKIEELSLFKEKMNSMLFHDIKLPINSIIKQTNSTQEQINTNQIRLQAEKVKRMLSNMLDIACSNKTRLEISKSEFRLSELLEKVCQKELYSFYNKETEFNCSYNDNDFKLLADRDLIERALINVIDNAVKYSPNYGEIKIIPEIDNQSLTLRILDLGPGVNEDEKNKIFKLFYTSSQQPNISKSSGIGLAFCKLVAEAHNGSMKFNAPKEGGSEFIFILPIVKSETNSITNISTKFKKQYSKEIRSVISRILPKLKALDYYQTSEIYALLGNISLKTLDKKNELEEIKSKALSCNQKSYSDLINQLS